MENKIFSIGYAGVKIQQFIDVLKENKITILIDVRSTPKSQYFTDYNDAKLKDTLQANGIKYENWKTEFGARQEDEKFFTDGIMDFEKFVQSEQFMQGIKRLDELVRGGKKVCLMCAEIDPIGCHRGILISRNICDVIHIVARTNQVNYETHKELEARLVSLYNKQPSFFGDDLQNAYRKQNQKIGYNK